MKNELHRLNEARLAECITNEYGLEVKAIYPANRGFYGLTWLVLTNKGKLFLKVDPWKFHQQSFCDGLGAVRFMVDHGIDFVPRIHKTLDEKLFVQENGIVLALFDYLDGEHLEHANLLQQFG